MRYSSFKWAFTSSQEDCRFQENALFSSINIVPSRSSRSCICRGKKGMDSSKILSGTEECSSSESGWTMYIASPEKEYDHDADEDEEDVSIPQHGYKKDEGEADSDDSMVSDASSGPSDQGNLYGRSRALGPANRDERKNVVKKHNQHEEKKKHREQITKGEKDKPANRVSSAGRFTKF